MNTFEDLKALLTVNRVQVRQHANCKACRARDIACSQANIDKATRELSYAPRYLIGEVLAAIVPPFIERSRATAGVRPRDGASAGLYARAG